MQLQFILYISTMNCTVKCINFQVMDKNFIKDSIYCEGNVLIFSDWNNGFQDVLDSDPVIILIFFGR
jgi:hypothetical protein